MGERVRGERQSTHWEGCERNPNHHACALARLDALRAALTQSAAEVKKLEGAGALALALAEKAERERDEALAYDAKRLENLRGCIDMVEMACDRCGVPRSELGILTWWHRASRAADNFARLERTVERLTEALRSIAANTCCDRCQEAALVAKSALAASSPDHAGAPEGTDANV